MGNDDETSGGVKRKKSVTDYFTPQIVIPGLIAIVVVFALVAQLLK